MATATLANTRLSFVDGTAFADFSASGSLTPFLGQRLTVYDSAGKKAIGYIKAVGTGETYGAELIDAWTNNVTYPFETFDVTGSVINSAINAAGNYGVCYKQLTPVSGQSMKVVLAGSVSSGTTPSFRLDAADTSLGTSGAIINQATVSGTYYATRTASAAKYTGFIVNGASEFAITGISLKQVLTPSATGATITSTPNGSTYNWASIEAGFNYNDASGYSFYVTSSSSGIYKRRMRVFKKR